MGVLSINVLGDAQEPRPDTEPHATPMCSARPGSQIATEVLARVENDRDERELYMNAFLKHTVARGFAQLRIAITGAPSLMRAAVWVALIVSASEAAAQLPTVWGDQR